MDQRFKRFIIGDLALDHKAVMSVRRIGVERHIADDPHLGHARLDGADSPADEIFRVERFARRLIAQARLRVREKRNCRHAQARRLLRPR